MRGPDGAVLPDLFGKLPGRGIHLCLDRACFRVASERQAFGRAFRAKVAQVDPESLADAFLAAGRRQVQALLATAVRSGWLVVGRDAVRDAVSAGRVALLLLADDAGAALEKQIGRLQASSNVPAWKMLGKDAYARYHGGRPVAVLGITHRGLASRMRVEIERIRALVEVDGAKPGEGLTELTPELVRGMMPQSQAGIPIDGAG